MIRRYPSSMSGKHFANTGQVLQLIVAIAGIIIAGKNAYSSIEARELFAFWPVLFYILLVASAFALAFQFRPAASTISAPLQSGNPIPFTPSPPFVRSHETKVDSIEDTVKEATAAARKAENERWWLMRIPAEAKPINVAARSVTFTMKLGERKTLAQGVNRLILELHGIDENAERVPYADLTVESFLDTFSGGAEVKKIGKNRFLVPRSTTSLAYSALFSLSFSDNDIDIDLIRVIHINKHSGHVDLTVMRCFGTSQSSSVV